MADCHLLVQQLGARTYVDQRNGTDNENFSDYGAGSGIRILLCGGSSESRSLVAVSCSLLNKVQTSVIVLSQYVVNMILRFFKVCTHLQSLTHTPTRRLVQRCAR